MFRVSKLDVNPFLMKSSILLLTVLTCLLPSCVLGRRTINPTVPSSSHATARGTVALGSMEDLRVFQNKPSDPSTPSVKGDYHSMSAAEKSRMVGRQRNSFGKAMGDIALPSGQSIRTKTEELLTEAFARRGYSLSGTSGNQASAEVRRFWAWFTPGMWYIQFEAVVECQITVSKGGNRRSFTVRGHGTNGGQVASNRNWNQAYEEAFTDFLANLDAELQRTGF